MNSIRKCKPSSISIFKLNDFHTGANPEQKQNATSGRAIPRFTHAPINGDRFPSERVNRRRDRNQWTWTRRVNAETLCDHNHKTRKESDRLINGLNQLHSEENSHDKTQMW